MDEIFFFKVYVEIKVESWQWEHVEMDGRYTMY